MFEWRFDLDDESWVDVVGEYTVGEFDRDALKIVSKINDSTNENKRGPIVVVLGDDDGEGEREEWQSYCWFDC